MLTPNPQAGISAEKCSPPTAIGSLYLRVRSLEIAR